MGKTKFKNIGNKKNKKNEKPSGPLSSKRRLSRFGTRQKSGHTGVSVSYISRSAALKRLQIPLKDFRRLCILKGIFPRDPSKAPAGGRSKTWYHVKDVSFLAHEPLLHKFRELKAWMKKVRRAAGRNQTEEARRIYDARPTWTLAHLVRERYPHFTDALNDIDDALCMVHLFAALPADKGLIGADVTAMCKRLATEWQLYVARTRCLRKVFLSIKGVYYQAEVMGVPITWLVPYPFSQALPADVDYRIMNTFTEFYTTLLKFVHFKLFADAGYAYPPVLDTRREAAGEHLGALMLRQAEGEAAAMHGASSDDEQDDSTAQAAPAAAARVASAVAALHEDADEDSMGSDAEDDSGEDAEEAAALAAALAETGGDDEAAAKAAAAAAAVKRQQNVFTGLTLFCSRETPGSVLELVALAAGGQTVLEQPGADVTSGSAGITHVIVDRPALKAQLPDREYVQPQWVVDCFNAGMLLPIKRYQPGAELPPHLSPFVDDAREGYMPAYREELDRLAAAARGEYAAGTATGGRSQAGALGDDDDEEADDHQRALAAEMAGQSYLPAEVDSEDEEEDSEDEDDEDEEEDSEAEDVEVAAASAPRKQARVVSSLGKLGAAPNSFASKDKLRGAKDAAGNSQFPHAADTPAPTAGGADSDEEQERRQLAASMLTSKKRRQYDIVQRSLRRSANHVARLQHKRQQVEAGATAATPAGKAGRKRTRK